MKKIAIEGINGAGKTPTINKVVSNLRGEGLKTEVFAPFHLVRDKLDIPDIYGLWATKPEAAVELLHETIDEIEDKAISQDLDVLLFDRHWTTVFSQEYKVPDIEELWGDRFVNTILFTAPVSHSLRLAERGYEAEWLQSDSIGFYTEIYEEIYRTHLKLFLGRFTVESSTQDLSPIAEEIGHMINSLQTNDII